MSKYDKLDHLVFQGKRMSIEKVIDDQMQEKNLESLDRIRTYRDNRDTELYDFGISLFENGYQLEDFYDQMKYWSVYSEANEKEFERVNTLWIRYMEETFKNVEKIPTYMKVLEMINNSALLKNVETGYNVAKRRALATGNINHNKGISR